MSDGLGRPLRSGPRLPMRGHPGHPNAGARSPMAKRTKNLVGLDIEPPASRPRPWPSTAACASSARPSRRSSRASSATARCVDADGLAEALKTLYREHKGSTSACASASPTSGSSSASSTCRRSTTPRSSTRPSASRRRTSFRCRSSRPCSTTSRSASSRRDEGRRQRVAARRRAPRDGRAPPRRRARRGPAARGRRPLGLRHGPRAAPRRLRGRARPLPRRRRTDEHRRGPRHHLHLHPRLRRRRRGPRHRAGGAQRADARARPRLAARTSAWRRPSRPSRATPRSSRARATILLDGVRRIAAEVRSSPRLPPHAGRRRRASRAPC